jgi:hypothetical protein
VLHEKPSLVYDSFEEKTRKRGLQMWMGWQCHGKGKNNAGSFIEDQIHSHPNEKNIPLLLVMHGWTPW